MSQNHSSTITSKKSYKNHSIKEETKLDSNYKNYCNSKDNILKNNDISIKNRKIRNSNSYIDTFLSRRKLAADHAQSRRCSSTKFENNNGELTLNENKNNDQYNKFNNPKKYTDLYSNIEYNINQNKGIINNKYKFLNDKEKNYKESKDYNSLNHFVDKKDKIYLKKYINKNNNIIVNRNNSYNYFSNFLTGNARIRSVKNNKEKSKNIMENKEHNFIDDDYDIKINDKDDSSNSFLNKINNDNFNSESNYCELKEPDELMKAQLPDDIQYDLIKYKKYYTNSNKSNTIVNLKQNSNIINKINKIINYSNNYTETKKFNTEEISTIKFQQQSVSNDTESQILLQEKSNINRNEKNIIKTNYSYRDNLRKNDNKKINNIIDYNDNDIIVPLSAKNKNCKYKNDLINDFKNVDKISKISNSIEKFHFIINENNLSNNYKNEKKRIKKEKEFQINDIESYLEGGSKKERKIIKNNADIKKDNPININISKNSKEEKLIETEKKPINKSNDNNEKKEKNNNEKITKNDRLINSNKNIISSEQFTINNSNTIKSNNNNFIICYNNNFEELKSEENKEKNKLIFSKENEIIINKINKTKINNKNIFQISKNNITFSNNNNKKENNKKNLDIKLEITNKEDLKIIKDLSPINYKNTNFLTTNKKDKFFTEEEDYSDIKNCKQNLIKNNNYNKIDINENNNNESIKENIKNKINFLYSEELYAPNIINIANKNQDENITNKKNTKLNELITENNDICNVKEINNLKNQRLLQEQKNIEKKREIYSNITERKNKLKQEISNLLNDNSIQKTTKENNNEKINKKCIKNEIENSKNNNNKINNNNYINNNKSPILQNLLQEMRHSKLKNINTEKNKPIIRSNNSNYENYHTNTMKENTKYNFNKTTVFGDLNKNNRNQNNMEDYYNSVSKIPDINLIVEKKPMNILFDEKEYKRIKDKNFGMMTTKKAKNWKYEMHNGKLWNTNINNNEDKEKYTYLNRVKEDILNTNKLDLYNTYALNNTNGNYSGNNLQNSNFSLRYRKSSTNLLCNKNDIMPVNNMIKMRNTFYKNILE